MNTIFREIKNNDHMLFINKKDSEHKRGNKCLKTSKKDKSQNIILIVGHEAFAIVHIESNYNRSCPQFHKKIKSKY